MPMLRFAWFAVLTLCVSCADPSSLATSDLSGYPVGHQEWIRAGLERYNGDDKPRADGELTKVHYARQIMNTVMGMDF